MALHEPLFMHDFPKTPLWFLFDFLRIGQEGFMGLYQQNSSTKDVIKREMSFKLGATQREKVEVSF